jgi:hypothetical protein
VGERTAAGGLLAVNLTAVDISEPSPLPFFRAIGDGFLPTRGSYWGLTQIWCYSGRQLTDQPCLNKVVPAPMPAKAFRPSGAKSGLVAQKLEFQLCTSQVIFSNSIYGKVRHARPESLGTLDRLVEI